MYLINTGSLELRFFGVAPEGQYAILSHTWEIEEMTFKEWRKGRASGKRGYKKIKLFCEQARYDGHEWAWVDTCW